MDIKRIRENLDFIYRRANYISDTLVDYENNIKSCSDLSIELLNIDGDIKEIALIAIRVQEIIQEEINKLPKEEKDLFFPTYGKRA